MQPWLMIGYAGEFTPTGAGIIQHGVSVFHNSMAYPGCNPGNNQAYEPHSFTMRKAIETDDYNGDGYNNTEDLRASVSSNPQGYAVGFIINCLGPYNPNSDSLTATIAETAPQPAYITFRTNSYDDLIPGDNLYAANSPIKRNNAHQYCSRYMNIVNHIGDGTGIGAEESWELMKNYSHPTIWSYMFMQYIPDWNVLNLSVLRDSTNAWELDSTRFYLREFFNHDPHFSSEPDTLAIIGEIYNYEVLVSDPDPFDTISISAEVMPDWLSFNDNGNGSASLYGTPDQAGNFEVILKASDGLSDTIQEFSIDAVTVNIPEADKSNILIYPTIFNDKIFVEIRIYNTSGICIKNWQYQNRQAGQNEFILDLNDLHAGIYFCRVQLGREMVTKKIIKVN